MLRLSTVSTRSRLSLTVSLAATTTTTNRHTLPCPALPRPSLHWRLSVLTFCRCCCSWFAGAAVFMCAHTLGRGQCHQSGTGGLFLFSKMSDPFPPSSSFLLFSCLPHFRSCSVCFSRAGGPVGLWVGALFHQPGASVRGLFHFASWC